MQGMVWGLAFNGLAQSLAFRVVGFPNRATAYLDPPDQCSILKALAPAQDPKP